MSHTTLFFPEATGANDAPIPLYVYRPSSWQETDPIFIAFSGFNRNAAGYIRRLAAPAEEYRMLVVCPDFTSEKYPGAAWYQEGHMIDSDDVGGVIQEKESWTFSAVDRLTEFVRREMKSEGQIFLFGHSAGGQFMHRYSLFAEHPTADAILCGNSGWFTMPDREIPFPYGLKGLPYTDAELARALRRNVVLFMGGDDISRKKPFRDTPEADAQGLNRMERCNNYFHLAEAEAHRLSVSFAWQYAVIQGAAHQGGKMAEGAMGWVRREERYRFSD